MRKCSVKLTHVFAVRVFQVVYILSREKRIDNKRYILKGNQTLLSYCRFTLNINYNMSATDENMYQLEAIKKSQKTLTLGLQ